MFEAAIDKLVHGLWFGAMTTILFFSGEAMGQTITVSKNDIFSLANTPAVLDAEGSIDEAGRPSLHLRLSFANACQRENGVAVKFSEMDTGTVYIFVFRQNYFM